MKKMHKILISAVVAIAILGGSIGGFLLYKNANTTVEVFPVSMISTSDYTYNDSSYGIVTTDMSQDVYITQDMVIQEILVAEGDMVSVGTPLIQLDNTLANLDLEMQALAIDNIDIQISAVNRDIHLLETASPVKRTEDINILDVSIQANTFKKLSSPGKEPTDPDVIVYRLD